jgi:hypothetical protein
MVLASRSPKSASWPVGEWAWPDPSKPGEARFVLQDRQEEELWGHLEQSRVSACNDLTAAEVGLVEILKKIRLPRRTTSIDLPNFARVSPRSFPLLL